MKKHVTLGIIAILFVLMLTGCSTYSYEETSIQTTVVQCGEGTFKPDPYYSQKALEAQMNLDLNAYSLNLTMANTLGSYEYPITVSLGEINFTVVRSEQYEVGQTITITEVKTFKDSELIKIEYK